MASSNTRPPNARMIQNFHLVWLDGSIDEEKDDDCHNSIKKLRQVVNTINTFTDVNECIDFINGIKEEKTFMISSGALGQTIVPAIHDKPQVNTIYIFCGNKTRHEQWTKQWPKVKGIFTDITPICDALKQAAQHCDHNLVSISFVQKADGSSNQNLDTLDQSFMYTQILKEILLTIDFDQSHINDFLSDCRTELAGNAIQLKNVKRLRKEYHDHQPIWWYTYESFLYSMLNRALRLMEVDRIIKMGFFVRDLNDHIAKLHAEQYVGQHHSNSFTVYHGQGLSQTDFDQLKNTQGGLLAFNNFLSASKNRNVSLDFAQRTAAASNLVGILFVMNIDPSISATPFANVKDVSCYQKEQEFLFSMHSVFHIDQVQQIKENNRLYQVNLTLTSDNDPQLYALTKRIQEEISGSTGWLRLGQLMIKLGQFNQAEELYNILLGQAQDQGEKAHLYHQLGWIKYGGGNYAEAVQLYENNIEIEQKTLHAKHPSLATSYNNIGLVYSDMGEYSKALSYYEKALEIWQTTLPTNHSLLATSYNNIGSVYDSMGEYSKALSYYEKALKISKKTRPENHPLLATSYNNIGNVYDSMGEYSKALSYYEKALKISKNTLPANHPDLATSYNNIGGVYYNMGEYSKALSTHEKALAKRQKTLPANHPDMATSYNNIGSVYNSVGEYSKSFSYYEKALEICQKTLPANHPDLATSYNNIGNMYDNMGEYSKALSYYEKALEIRQETLSANHPSLATSYNNMGVLYYNMGEYLKALSYCEKALEIRQETLPANHPDLATSYSNIGLVYKNMGEYSKSLSSHDKALEISKNTLPANHPLLATSYNNIGNVYDSTEEYSKALSYYEKALEIRQETLPANHLDLATSYNNIGVVYYNMEEYSKALSSHDKALEIYQKTLPENHSLLATSYNNIGNVYDSIEEYSKALSYLERALDIWKRSLPTNHPHLKIVKESIEIVKKNLK